MTSNKSSDEPADLLAGGGLSPLGGPEAGGLSPLGGTECGGLSPSVGTEGAGFVRIRLSIAYDGTDFSGWAIQPDRRTVCGEITAALSTILRIPVALTVAGRTDAGVHASGQVAHVDLPVDLWQDVRDSLIRRLAGLLPADVRVRDAQVAPPDFDARFSGLSRTYVYRISDHRSGVDPLRRRDVIGWPRALDVDRMQWASQGLLGLHDFAAYCKPRPEATTIRTLQSLRWTRESDGNITGLITADAFCHSMVRSLVGALLAVGDGNWDIDLPVALLGRSTRFGRITVAPARGLTLVSVQYPPDDQLRARNAVTRRRRSDTTG